MAKTLYWQDDAAVEQICSAMKCGGVVVGTSDTVFGLLASLDDEGRARLDQIKGRQDKPYLVLVGSLDDAKRYVDETDLLQTENIAKSCWPGPLTIIFKAKSGAPACVQSPQGSVAIRVPRHDGLQRLLACSGGLFSTSANKAGERVPAAIEELDPAILEHVGAVVLDRHEKRAALPVPSTIIDVTGPKIKIIREGAYPRELLLQLLGDDHA